MITGKSEPKILTKDILCNVNLMEESVILIKSGIMINVDVSVKIWKNILCVKKIIFGMLLHAVVKMVNTVIMCDEIIEEIKTISTTFNEKK